MPKISSFSPAPLLLCTPAASTIFPFLSAIRASIQKVYAKLSRLPLNTSKSITQRSARELRPVSDNDIRALQTVADRSYKDQILPAQIEVRSITDQSIWTK